MGQGDRETKAWLVASDNCWSPARNLVSATLLDPRILGFFPDFLNICEHLCVCIYIYNIYIYMYMCAMCVNSVLIIIIIRRNLGQVFGQFICNHLLSSRFILFVLNLSQNSVWSHRHRVHLTRYKRIKN